MTGIYVHLPFCPYICPYCDFAKWPHRRSQAARYMAALLREIDGAVGLRCGVRDANALLSHASIPQHDNTIVHHENTPLDKLGVLRSTPAHPAPVDTSAIRGASQAQDDYEYGTVFLGGGTPNTYEPGEIAHLLDVLREKFPGPQNRETTIEINPELVRLPRSVSASSDSSRGDRENEQAGDRENEQAGDLAAYRAAGITRVSIGVQSFVEPEITTLGRKHTPQDVERVVRAARGAGIGSISLDLIFGVPGQSVQSWRESLERAIALGVDHISTYGLTVEAGTPYEQWREREPRAFADDALEADLYDLAIGMLEDAGYEHYEISNFARPGHRSAHNANYWRNGEYLGFGVGAASYRGGVRSVHTRDLAAYLEAVESGRPIPGEREELDGAARAGEAAMLALRTAQGVALPEFKERYGLDFLEFYAPVVAELRDGGLLTIDDEHVRLTRRGRFLANDVCAAFVTSA